MDLRKGLSLTAYGFLLLLVDVNLTLSGSTFCLTPDFVGWILLFLAWEPLGDYTASHRELHWIPAVMALVSGLEWAVKLFRPELWSSGLSVLSSLGALVTAAYVFLLFSALERLAADHQSPQERKLHTLKYLVIGLEAAFCVTGLLTLALEQLALLVLILGVAALVTAVAAVVTLFRLRRELQDRSSDHL